MDCFSAESGREFSRRELLACPFEREQLVIFLNFASQQAERQRAAQNVHDATTDRFVPRRAHAARLSFTTGECLDVMTRFLDSASQAGCGTGTGFSFSIRPSSSVPGAGWHGPESGPSSSFPWSGTEVDGVSLLPVLTEGKSLGQRRLFWEHGKSRAMRDGPWKLVAGAPGQKQPGLFYLTDDLHEQNDLAEREPARLTGMMAAIKAWEKDMTADASPQPDSPPRGAETQRVSEGSSDK